MHQPILIQIIHVIKESRARNDIPSPINETDIPVLKNVSRYDILSENTRKPILLIVEP